MYFIHNDHLGTPVAVTDHSQAVVWRGDRKPFGETETSGSIEEDTRFTGQLFDQETEYSYNYFRDYDPTTGRYIQSDPIGLEGGLNTYGYVFQNPMSYFDPYGLDAFLASRPTFAGPNHMFIVYGANPAGVGGTVRSFGKQGNGKLGEVDFLTTGISSGTLQKDIDFWTEKTPGLVYQRIDASDCDVKKAADDLQTPWRYTYPPIWGGAPLAGSGHLTMNSNTAAQAVANRAVGRPVKAPPGFHPGAENARLLRFR